MKIKRQSDVEKAGPGRHGAGKCLVLIVDDKGKRRWVLRYIKPSTGKPTEMGLGSADDIKLADAREIAHEHRKVIAKGEDPIELKREARRAKKTFADEVQEFLAFKKGEWRGERTYGNMERLLLIDAAKLAKKPLAAITANDVEAAVKHLWEQSWDKARRTLAGISEVFEYAINHEHCATNPAEWKRIGKRFPKRKGEEQHFEALDYAKAPSYMKQLHAEQQSSRALSPVILECIMLTGCRASEMTKMKKSEIDFENRIWTIPASRTKANRPHRVPLCERAYALLKQQYEKAKGEYLWPGRKPNQPITRHAVYLFQRKLLDTATVHGHRSMLRDWSGNETNFDQETNELALAHKFHSKTEGSYRRSDALEKRRALMTVWGAFCNGQSVPERFRPPMPDYDPITNLMREDAPSNKDIPASV